MQFVSLVIHQAVTGSFDDDHPAGAVAASGKRSLEPLHTFDDRYVVSLVLRSVAA